MNLRLVFGMDARSLAAFRVGLALVVLADLATRALSLTEHYTDAGVLPRSALIERPFDRWHLSVLMASGAPAFAKAVFGACALAATAMLVGWRTRAATVATWVLFCSIVSRNEMILQGSDTVLRVFLFWAMFLPLGAVWSVDRARAQEGYEPPRHVLSAATVAVQLQTAYLFWFTVFLKTSRDWWPDGTAVYYALHWNELATPASQLLLGLGPEFLRFMTLFVFVFEAAGPFLFFVPWRVGPVRTVALALFACVFVGFAVNFRLGVWPFAGAAALLPFVPGWLWDHLGRRVRWDPSRLSTAIRARLGARPLAWRTRRATNALVAAALVYVTWWNVCTVTNKVRMPADVAVVGDVLRLDQTWNMFAPGPRHDGGWWVLVGQRADGGEAFLLPEAAHVGWERPSWPADVYASHRWRLYMWQLWFRARSAYRPYLARYLCDRSRDNRERDDDLRRVSIYYMREQTLADDVIKPAEKTKVLDHDCGR